MARAAISINKDEYNRLREIWDHYPGVSHAVVWPLDYDIARGQAGAAEDDTRTEYEVFSYKGRYGVAPLKWLTKSFYAQFRKFQKKSNPLIPNPALAPGRRRKPPAWIGEIQRKPGRSRK